MSATGHLDELLVEIQEHERHIDRLENASRVVDECRHVAALLRAEVWRIRLRERLARELNP